MSLHEEHFKACANSGTVFTSFRSFAVGLLDFTVGEFALPQQTNSTAALRVKKFLVFGGTRRFVTALTKGSQ